MLPGWMASISSKTAKLLLISLSWSPHETQMSWLMGKLSAFWFVWHNMTLPAFEPGLFNNQPFFRFHSNISKLVHIQLFTQKCNQLENKEEAYLKAWNLGWFSSFCQSLVHPIYNDVIICFLPVAQVLQYIQCISERVDRLRVNNE